jgi:hypothetical protein
MVVKCYVCNSPLEVADEQDFDRNDLICQECFDKNREKFDLEDVR